MHNFPNSHYITAWMVPTGHCPGTRYLFTARDARAVLNETIATVSLCTDISRCRRTETVLYAPTQRRPSSGLRIVSSQCTFTLTALLTA